ncbi:MAG: polysaccharide deacetylase family protein [Fimbriimonadaceae bacterium]|nr:polysaccharide deacetylase family protein [Fimbriimonadaceae bacterium]QYK55781.1 MAG: polysaccharide deacetylase family protein [Fimbriimonadaceae bacterium]
MAEGSVARVSPGIVSLTYDGTQACHIHKVLPVLERTGLKATFYAEPSLALDHASVWRQVVEAGHELGNGTLVSAALPDGSLPAWTVDMVQSEVLEADQMLREVFPAQRSFSFAFPWGPPRCAENVDYSQAVARNHPVCRTGILGFNPLPDVDLTAIKCVPMIGASFSGMTDVVRAAIDLGHWAVLSYDGVGTGDRSVDADAHEAFCEWLAVQQNVVVAPVIEVSQRLAPADMTVARLM